MNSNFKRIVIVFFCLWSVKLQAYYNASDTIKSVSGEFTELKILYNNGKTREIIRLKGNKLHGVQKSFNTKETLLSEIEYNEGLLCGIYKKYNGEGQLKEMKTYNCSQSKNSYWLDGVFEEYNNGKLTAKGKYQDSVKVGKWKTYFYNGKKKSISTYKHGNLIGNSISYHENGITASTVNYIQINNNNKIESVKHGKYQSFNYNGNIEVDGFYVQGKKSGLWYEYQTKGALRKETFYKEGKIYGINNTYNLVGKLERECQFYEEIEVNGKNLKNIFHGAKITYHSDGTVKSKEFYNYGKKEGTWQQYYSTGKLNEEVSYKNNLEIGKKINYDESGFKISEKSFEIIKSDTSEISVKSGVERRWQKGIMVYETNHVLGKENGVRKSYNNNGMLLSVQTFKDDLLDGESIEYYENGQIKTIRNYCSKYANATYDKKHLSVGFAKYFNEDGSMASKIYYDSLGNVALRYIYNNNKLSQFTIEDFLELNYFPNGKLQSEKIKPKNSQISFSRYYFMNGNVRKVSFQNAENLQINTVHYKSNGKLHYSSGSYYNKSDTLLASTATISAINAATNQKSMLQKYYSDTIKNGNYNLSYSNGKKFASMSFKEDIPDGDFIFYHPITNDTMLFAQFKNGYLNGAYIEKFGGKFIRRRGTYCNNYNCGTWIENDNSGKINAVRKYNASNGKSYAIDEYYDNGKLKSSNNYETDEYESRDENGNIISKSYIIDSKRKLSVYENYFINTNKLKSKNFYINKAQDSIAETYFESGKLQSKMSYSFGKRNGAYYEYFENGNLKRKSNYENDKLEGMAIVVSEAGIDTMYYRNNNLKVKPNGIACNCVDTTHSVARNGFAPSLNQLFSYDNLLSYIPNYLKPVDSLNYRSIFYTGFQNSNGSSSGFSAMNLMIFKEFAFNFPADEQIKLIFNPCITKGYISRMNISASYNTNTRDNFSVDFSPKKIALEFLKGPVKSADNNHTHFKAFFNTNEIRFTSKKELKLELKEKAEACFVPALINNLLSVEVSKADPYIFKPLYSYNLSKYDVKLSEAEQNLFFGILANEATVQLKIKTAKGNEIVKGDSDFMLLGGNYACGVVKINCVKNDDGTYTSTSNKVIFTEEQMRKTLEEKGFSRINIKYASVSTNLSFTFFTE